MKNLFILPLFFPFFLNAQSRNLSDSISETDCNDRIFVKVQEPPKLKISQEAFTDSLMTYLSSKKNRLKDKIIFISFIVTSKSEIFDLINESTGNIKDKDLEDALFSFSNLWLPAKQNSFIVCARVRCKFEFRDKSLQMKILP
jgi:hypothetical protein